MPHIHATTCEIKKEGLLNKFSACTEKPVGLCIYCGRAFCPAHGERQDDGQEICSRKNCVAKKEDLLVHLNYRAAVTKENDRGTCGIPACREKPDGQCARCKAFFCQRHIDAREETVVHGRAQLRQMATLCGHCWQRRPIWSRM